VRESTIRARGRTRLPKQVRGALGVSAGGRVRYLFACNGVRVV
jgi:hypothetical protein